MAEVIVNNPTVAGIPQQNASAAMVVGQNIPQTSAGTEGVGTHIDNAALSANLTNELTNGDSTGLLHTDFDKDVTIMGYPDTVLNQTFRTLGHRSIKSMQFDHFSIDQRKSSDFVGVGGVSLPSTPAGGKVFKDRDNSPATSNTEVQVPVVNAGLFHESDQITFKGISGFDKNGLSHPFYYLNGYVTKVNRTGAAKNTLEVVLTNFCPAPSESSKVPTTIPAGTEILIIGHALAEEDSHVPPSAKLPQPSQCFMQKFMTMTAVTNVYLESDKNINWGLDDMKKGTVREFLLEIEKTFWFGHKSYFQDPETGKMIRTMGGILEQLFEEGVEAIEIWKDELTDESIIETMSTIFVGNRGSEKRYMLTGMDFASALFSLKSMRERVSTNTKTEFTYEWDMWKLFNYTIQNKPYALFDMLGYGNWAFIYDKANFEYCVFRPMDEDQLDLDKLMIEDTKQIRCSEISSLVVKYAKCHRLIVMHDGDSKTNPTGANDKVRYAA